MNNEEGRSAPTAEANVFATSPAGFSVHFKLTFPEASGVLVGFNNLNKVIEALVNAGFTAGAPQSGGPRGAPGQSAPRPAGPPAPKCEQCGSDVWDNRANKRNPKGPDFVCKDKDGCGLRGWLQKDGGVEWKYAPV